MDFTKFDASLFIIMSLAIIIMAFTMPQLGYASTSPNESDIPRFNTTAGEFELAAEYPDNPGTPSTGTLEFIASESAITDRRQLWFHGDTSSGTETVLLDNGSNTEAKIVINYWDSGSAPQDELILSDPGDAGQIDNDTQGWTVEYEFVERTNNGTSNVTMEVDYEIVQRPSDQQWYTAIPIIGPVFSTGSQLPGAVGYLAGIVWWFVTTIFETALTVVVTIFDVLTYLASMMFWVLSTYDDVVTQATGFAAVMTMVPLIVMFYLFSKIMMLGVKLLPTT